MAIRTLVTGISGMVGFILWYFAMVATGMWWVLIAAIYKHGTFGPFDRQESRTNDLQLCLFVGSFLLCGFGVGALILFLGEKLHLFPSQEKLDQQTKPISLFSTEDRRP